MKFRLLSIIIIIIALIQFIPYGKNKSNPSVISEPEWDSPRTREIFFRSCSDCHSHHTKWPWYSYIAPLSWLVQRDVEEGRRHFNVSKWGAQKKNEGHWAAREVNKGEMPLWIYLIGHPEARLSENDKKELIKGLLETFSKEKGNSEQKEHDHSKHKH